LPLATPRRAHASSGSVRKKATVAARIARNSSPWLDRASASAAKMAMF